VVYYRGLKFPHWALVLLVLESDGACTSLNDHCARKSAVLVLVCCYKARGDREQYLWRYWLSEGCIKQRYDRVSGYGCESRWSNEAVTLLYLVSLPSTVTYRVGTRYSKRYDYHNGNPNLCSRYLCASFIISQVSWSLLFLTYVVSSKIWICHELDWWNNVTGLFFLSLANHKYDLCSYETWMLNKPDKSLMQPMTVCLPWLNSYRCHTQLYVRLWKYLSSYSKLVELCVWIFFYVLSEAESLMYGDF
jgi:hypothetical protein